MGTKGRLQQLDVPVITAAHFISKFMSTGLETTSVGVSTQDKLMTNERGRKHEWKPKTPEQLPERLEVKSEGGQWPIVSLV